MLLLWYEDILCSNAVFWTVRLTWENMIMYIYEYFDLIFVNRRFASLFESISSLFFLWIWRYSKIIQSYVLYYVHYYFFTWVYVSVLVKTIFKTMFNLTICKKSMLICNIYMIMKTSLVKIVHITFNIRSFVQCRYFKP